MKELNDLIDSILNDSFMEPYRDEPGLKEMLAREVYLTFLRVLLQYQQE